MTHHLLQANSYILVELLPNPLQWKNLGWEMAINNQKMCSQINWHEGKPTPWNLRISMLFALT